MLTICLPAAATAAPPTGWIGPEPVSAPAGSIKFPDLYQLDDGRAVMAWGQWNEAAGVVIPHACFYDPASGWGEPVMVTRANQDCLSVRCLLLENGSAMVAFVHRLSSVDVTFRASVYTPEGGWTLDYGLAGQTRSIGDVQMARLPGGSVLSMWTESDGSQSMVRYRTWSWGNGWSQPQDLAGDSLDNVNLADLDLRPDGTGMALLVENDAGLLTAHASFRSSDGEWTVPSPVSSDNIDGRIVGANAGSEAVAVYTTNNKKELWAVSWNDGWSAPVELYSSETAYSVDMKLDVNQEGQGLLVQRRTAGQWGFFSISFSGGTWGSWERLSPEVTGPSWSGDFAVDVNAAGEGVAAFYGKGPDLDKLDYFANRYSPSAGWGGPERVSTAFPFGVGNIPPVVSIGPDGSVLYGFAASTSLFDPQQYRVYINTYRAEDSTPPRLVVSSPSSNERVNVSSVEVSGTTDPGARVVVGGIELAVDAGGNFRGRVPVVPGENRLSVTAIDEHGNEAIVDRTVFFDDPLQEELDRLADELLEERDSVQEELAQAHIEIASLKSQGLMYLGLASAAMAVGVLGVFLYLRERKA